VTRPEGLIGAAIDELPERCRSCLFWELGRPRPDPRVEPVFDELAGDPRVAKHGWCGAQNLQYGAPGRVIRSGEKVVAHALWAGPGEFSPRRPPIPATSNDALVLATLWVDPPEREQGLARQLVQSAVKEAIARGLLAVEAYGDRRFREAQCVLPAVFLLHEGFVVHREHPRYLLLRLDVRRTLRWTESIEAAWGDVRERLPRRVPVPTPGSRAETPPA
jgi:GNAT superfamily N-acetyltransferase